MRRLGPLVLALLIAGCTTETIPVVDGSRLDGSTASDAGPPVDSGPRPDAGPRLDDVLIYAHSRDTLYTFSPYSNTVTEIGPFLLADGSPAPDMTDLAVDSLGNVFTSSDDSRDLEDRALWRLDPATARVTKIGEFGLPDERFFALSFLAPGESPDGTEILIAATNAGAYYEIDLDDATPAYLGSYPEGWTSSGDIVSVDGFGTFATVRHTDFPGDVLARILFAADGSSTVTVIGAISDGSQDFREIFGLGYWGTRFYGFNNDGQLLEIDRDTGEATVVSTSTGSDEFWGAGVTVEVPFLI